jgi:tricarballylate dehydrogenase
LPIDSPPYSVYPVACGITFTFGGLQVDSQARVIDTEDNAIPGLYATGEITGDFFYHNYPGGTGLMRGAVFGRISGANAAAEAQGKRA